MFDWLPSGVRWAFGALVLAIVVWWLVLPQFDDADDAIAVLSDVEPVRIGIAAALIAIAFVAQAQMVRSVLGRSVRPSLFDAVRIELSSAAVSHTAPGGTAAGTALGYRLLTRAGVPGPSAGFAIGVRGIGSALVLNVGLWVALAVWVPLNGFRSTFAVTTVIGAIAFLLIALALLAVRRAERKTVRVVGRLFGAIPGVERDAVVDVAQSVVDRLHELADDRRLALRVSGYAAVHWLAEAGSLWILLAAFGWSGEPLALFIAFGVVNVLGVVPITPRGLGIVEAVLIPMLIALDAPGQVAAVGVLAWRLLSFWAPIVVGGLSYLSLRVQQPPVDSKNPSSDQIDTGHASGHASTTAPLDQQDGEPRGGGTRPYPTIR